MNELVILKGNDVFTDIERLKMQYAKINLSLKDSANFRPHIRQKVLVAGQKNIIA